MLRTTILLNDQYQLTGVIDWGDSELLHPAVDLAFIYQFFPPAEHHLFWDIYDEIDDTTRLLAILRAIYSSITLVWYAHQIQDSSLLREAHYSLRVNIR